MTEPALRVLQLDTPKQIRAELERVGADSSLSPGALAEQIARAQFQIIKLCDASLPLARLLYQELTMEGGLVVTPPRLDHIGEGRTVLLLCATRYQYNHLLVRLRWQPSDELGSLADEIERALDRFAALPASLTFGATVFDWSRTYIVGILNLTPDSFSGDALLRENETESALIARTITRARELVGDGADMLDIGGESTRPGAAPVAAEVELKRVLPVLRALGQELSVPLSIDTSKAVVADAALNAGAMMVNDVTGLRGDKEMKRVIAANDAPVVLMHNWLRKERPAAVTDILDVIIAELSTQIDTALGAGIEPDRLLIDPGLGFGKTPQENLTLLNRLGELRVFGLPVFIGPSRKGFISQAIGVPVDEREEGTAASMAVGILRGANIVRVHNVKMMSRIARMTDAIRNN